MLGPRSGVLAAVVPSHRVKAFTRDRIMSALRFLADQLPAGQPQVELIIVGGAAMVLLFGARESTKDVDAFSLEPGVSSAVSRAAAAVATALGLPDDWLNDGAKGYAHGVSPGAVLLDTPALRVRAVSVEQLLAMKLSAWRDDLDVEDARRLLQECGPVRDEVWREVEPYVVPGREMKARYAFEDLWESERESA